MTNYHFIAIVAALFAITFSNGLFSQERVTEMDRMCAALCVLLSGLCVVRVWMGAPL